MQGQRFEWDRDKNISNIEKHGIPFKVAATVFFDPNALLFDDDGHSRDENRFIIIGFGKNYRLLTVCHCYRENGDVIRIISARKATKTEQGSMEAVCNGNP
ncbi:MAG: BrnT family toxin [Oscillospiraceae bacterium]|nr:BrnT family toxin [Oscillospiraceae bacterium]